MTEADEGDETETAEAAEEKAAEKKPRRQSGPRRAKAQAKGETE